MARQPKSGRPRIPKSVIIAAVTALALTPGRALAQINNEALAEGSHDGQSVTSNPAAQSVPVAPPDPRLSVSVAAPSHDDLDGSGNFSPGDGLTYRISVANTGNIRLDDVSPGELRPRFGQAQGDNLMVDFVLESEADDLEPGQTAMFSGRYDLTQPDIFRAAGVEGGVAVVATALALRSDTGEIYVSPASRPVAFNVPAEPELALEKFFEFAKDTGAGGKADPGDVIIYTYRVTNTGNVPVEHVTMADIHEGLPIADGLIVERPGPVSVEGPLDNSGDNTEGDGVWDVLGQGATVEFTYEHTVTQAEFAAQ